MPQVDGEAAADTTTEANAPAATQGEAADQQTATATKSDDTSTNGASADDANGSSDNQDNSNGTGDAGQGSGDQAEAQDGSGADKQENRVGYQLRQLRNNDSYVTGLRKNLQDNYVNEDGITAEEARIRRIEANDYVEKVEKSRAELVADNERAVSEIDIFRPKNPDGSDNPEFNASLYKRAMERYSRDQLVTETDENGREQIVGYKVPLLAYLREEADAYKAGVDTAKRSRQTADNKSAEDKAKADARMDANSETPGHASNSGGKPEKTSFDEAFEAGFDSVK